MHCEVHSADSSIFSWPNRVSFALTFSEHSGLKHFSFNNFTDRAAVQILQRTRTLSSGGKLHR